MYRGLMVVVSSSERNDCCAKCTLALVLKRYAREGEAKRETIKGEGEDNEQLSR